MDSGEHSGGDLKTKNNVDQQDKNTPRSHGRTPSELNAGQHRVEGFTPLALNTNGVKYTP